MKPILISRIAAEDLVDYWDEVDVNDDESEYAQDNAEDIGGVRDAYIILKRKLEESGKALLLVELETAGARELFNEAENRLDIARDAVKALHPNAEAKQRNVAKALYHAYKRLLAQK